MNFPRTSTNAQMPHGGAISARQGVRPAVRRLDRGPLLDSMPAIKERRPSSKTSSKLQRAKAELAREMCG